MQATILSAQVLEQVTLLELLSTWKCEPQPRSVQVLVSEIVFVLSPFTNSCWGRHKQMQLQLHSLYHSTHVHKQPCRGREEGLYGKLTRS